MKTTAWQDKKRKALAHGSGRRGRRTRARAGGDSQGHAREVGVAGRGALTLGRRTQQTLVEGRATAARERRSGGTMDGAGPAAARDRGEQGRKEADGHGGIIYDGIYWSWILGRIRCAR